MIVGVFAAGLFGVMAQRHIANQSGPVAQKADPAPTVAGEIPSAATKGANVKSSETASVVPPAKVPEVLPAFSLLDRDGKSRSLQDWKGKMLVVNYWATWCPPCVREIPLLNQLRRERAAKNVEVIGIAVDFRDDVLKFLNDKPIEYPLLIGEEDGLEAVKAVGMTPAFPFTLFADSKQRIVALRVGELHHDEASMILDRVADVDSGKLSLTDAREQITQSLKLLSAKRATEKG